MKDTAIKTTVSPHIATQLREIAGTDDVNAAASEVLRRATLPTDAQVRKALRIRKREKLIAAPLQDPTKPLRDLFARIDAKADRDEKARR